MKRILLFSAYLIFCMSSLLAQVGQPRTDFAVGVNAGIAMNRMSFKPSIRQKFKIGPVVGLTARYTCENTST